MSKKFLTRQAESITEYGVQLRTDEPSVPVDNQPYYNSSVKKLKLKTSSNTFVVSEADHQRNTVLTSENIDLSQTETAQVALSQITADSILFRSIVFDGTTYLETALAQEDMGDNCSFTMWVRFDSLVDQCVFVHGSRSLKISSGNIVLDAFGSSVSNAYSFVLGNFYHISCSFTATDAYLYINGQLIGSTSYSLTTFSGAPLIVGNFTDYLQPAYCAVSSFLLWENKTITDEAFILYKRGYTTSPDFLYNYDPDTLLSNYLTGNRKNYIFNITSASSKSYNIKIENDTDYSAGITFNLTAPLTFNQASLVSGFNPDDLEVFAHRVQRTTSISNSVFIDYRDNYETSKIVDETGNKDFLIANGRATYLEQVAATPVLTMSSILEGGAYLTTTPLTSLTATALSISLWIKFDPTQNPQQILTWGNLELYVNGTTLYLKKGPSVIGTVSFDLSNPVNQTWQHMVVSWDQTLGDLYLYKNGVQVIGLPSQTDPDFLLTPTGSFYLGAKLAPTPTAEIDAKVANLEIWEDALTLGDANTLYTAGYYGPIAPAIVLKTLRHQYLMGDFVEDDYTIIQDYGSINALITEAPMVIDTILLKFDINDLP